jgi:holo-[acyl-carrier protein] synthase
MIKGCGVDIVEIERIERLVARYGELFTRKIYTPAETALCRAIARPGVRFAGRWAAKEAFYKALPDRCQKVASWKSIEMLTTGRAGRPVIRVVDAGLQEALEREGVTSWHVSVSHERHHCVVFVVLE